MTEQHFDPKCENMNKHIGLFLLFISGFISLSFMLPSKERTMLEKLMTEGFFQKALAHMEQLPEYSNDAEYLLLKGICFYKVDSCKTQAVPILRQALSKSEDKKTDIDILYHLAQAHVANENYIEAIKSYNRLQERIPAKYKTFHQKVEDQIGFCSEQLQKYGNMPRKKTMPSSAQPSDSLVQTGLPPSSVTGKKYTIQICSMSFPLSDSFFKGQYGVKLIRMGDLYRYIYNIYDSIPDAQKDLSKVRKIYPDAFIREFDENKLGKAVDLNIENIK